MNHILQQAGSLLFGLLIFGTAMYFAIRAGLWLWRWTGRVVR